MGIRTQTIMATEQSQALSRRPKKKGSSSSQEIVLDDMPFISFEQPGHDSDGERQKIIRKHLGRRRKKMTPQREPPKRASKDPKQDLISILCTCDPDVPELLSAAATDGRAMSLEICQGCGKNRFVEGVISSSPTSLMSSPMVGSICDNFTDPFGMLPVESSSPPYMHGLIKHFIEVTAPSTIPLPEYAHLFPNVSAALSLMAHDETLLQAVLSLAAMHLEFLQGSKSLSASTLEERGKAIALLNQNLTNPTDGLIVAVTILGSCEMVAGNQDSWQAHMLGLRNLIHMRGGMNATDLIRDAVLECDAVGSVIFGVQPYLSSFVDTSTGLSEYGKANLPYEFISIDSHLRNTFVAMRSLCQTVESTMMSRAARAATFDALATPVDRSVLHDFATRRSVIEYRLLHQEHELDLSDMEEEDAEADEDDENVTAEATRVLVLAAKIFTYLVFRKIMPSSLIHSRLAVRLREAILAFDRHASSQHATCLLLWASVMGCMALQAGPLRTWFLGWVAHCVSELDVCSEVDLKYQMSKIAWVDGLLAGHCGTVWQELEELERMGVEVRFVGND